MTLELPQSRGHQIKPKRILPASPAAHRFLQTLVRVRSAVLAREASKR